MSSNSVALPSSGETDGFIKEYDVRCPSGGQGLNTAVDAFMIGTFDHIDLTLNAAGRRQVSVRVFPDRRYTERDSTRALLHMWEGTCVLLDGEENEVGPRFICVGRLHLQVTDAPLEAGKLQICFPTEEETL